MSLVTLEVLPEHLVNLASSYCGLGQFLHKAFLYVGGAVMRFIGDIVHVKGQGPIEIVDAFSHWHDRSQPLLDELYEIDNGIGCGASQKTCTLGQECMKLVKDALPWVPLLDPKQGWLQFEGWTQQVTVLLDMLATQATQRWEYFFIILALTDSSISNGVACTIHNVHNRNSTLITKATDKPPFSEEGWPFMPSSMHTCTTSSPQEATHVLPVGPKPGQAPFTKQPPPPEVGWSDISPVQQIQPSASASEHSSE
jgi:hypothetical protein